jgi:diguanylate cyclase (GGDEF)-like protein
MWVLRCGVSSRAAGTGSGTIESDTGVRTRSSAHEQLHTVINRVSDAVIVTNGAGIVTDWSASAETIYRLTAESAIGMHVSDAVGALVDPAELAQTGMVLDDTHHAEGGAELAVRVSAVQIDDSYLMISSDRTELSRAARLLGTVVDALAEGIVVFDRDGAIATINPAAVDLFGLDLDGLPVDHAHRIKTFTLYGEDGLPVPPEDRPILQTLRTGQTIRNRIFGLDRPDGRRVWMSGGTYLLNPDDEEHRAVLLSVSDVTAQRAINERLAYRAHHDDLTGLPNRAYILDLLADAIRPQELGGAAAVCYIDLHGLKIINDSLGHHAGDVAIQTVAQLLRAALRPQDVFGRVGGDEFVALLCGATTRAEIGDVMAGLHAALSQPLIIENSPQHVNASIGITVVSDDEQRAAGQLLRDADQAMYRAKASDGGQNHYFDETVAG